MQALRGHLVEAIANQLLSKYGYGGWTGALDPRIYSFLKHRSLNDRESQEVDLGI